jgi:hypothetical protein
MANPYSLFDVLSDEPSPTAPGTPFGGMAPYRQEDFSYYGPPVNMPIDDRPGTGYRPSYDSGIGVAAPSQPNYPTQFPGTSPRAPGEVTPLGKQLLDYIRQQSKTTNGKATQGMASLGPQSQGMLPLQPGASSSRGLLSNSKQGVGIDTIMKLVKAYMTGGSSLIMDAAGDQTGGGGMMGATATQGGPAGAAGTAGGGMSASGAMGMLGNLFGGKKASPAVLPQMQTNTSRLYG